MKQIEEIKQRRTNRQLRTRTKVDYRGMNGEKGNKQKERTENAQEEQGDTRNATTPKEPKDKPVKRDKPKKVDYEDHISVITELSKHITAIEQELQTATQSLVESRTKEK